jgi:hypothetical protein
VVGLSRRVGCLVVLIGVLAPLGASGLPASPAVAASTGVRQIAIADGPHGVLLGLLDSSGNFWAKFLTSPNWTLEFSGGQTEIAVADGPHGPVLGRLDSSGTFWAKAGGLSTDWVREQTSISQITVADGGDGPMVGYVSSGGVFYAKTDGLSAVWVHQYGGGTLGTVAAGALADGSGGPDFGVLLSNGDVLAKTGVGSSWTTEATGMTQISLADGPDGSTLGMLAAGGDFYAKTGGVGGTLINEYSAGQTAIAVGDGPHGPLLGRLDQSGTFFAKSGMGSAWTHEFGVGQQQIAVADGNDGPVLARVDSSGDLYVKTGGLSTTWTLQYEAPAAPSVPPTPTPTPTPSPSPPTTQVTPVSRALGAVHARFVISWRWDGRRTTLRSIRVRGLPSGGRLAIRCHGRGCPRIHQTAAGASRIRKLLHRLGGRGFTTGERILITLTAPGHTAERIRLTIRRSKIPLAELLSGG